MRTALLACALLVPHFALCEVTSPHTHKENCPKCRLAARAAQLLQAEGEDEWALFTRYLSGDSVTADRAKAEKHLLQAAKAGNMRAIKDLANAYATNGLQTDGNRQDFHKAAKWYRAAAEQGDAESQSNLGTLYVNGWGLPKDPYSAYIWMSVAKMHGYKNDSMELKRLAHEELPPKKLATAKVAARSLKKGIDDGDVLGFYGTYDPLGLSEAMRRIEAQGKLASRLLRLEGLSSE